MPKGMLITVNEVRDLRTKMHKDQNFIDPTVNCPIEFSKAVLDHDHSTDHCRAALHRQSNAALGKIENAYIRYIKPFFNITIDEWLSNVGQYVSADYSANPLHPAWIKRLQTKFNYLNAKQKDLVLRELGAYERPSNDSKRKLAFGSLLKQGLVTKGEVLEIINYVRSSN
jgi:hypothetical protein